MDSLILTLLYQCRHLSNRTCLPMRLSETVWHNPPQPQIFLLLSLSTPQLSNHPSLKSPFAKSPSPKSPLTYKISTSSYDVRLCRSNWPLFARQIPNYEYLILLHALEFEGNTQAWSSVVPRSDSELH